MTYTSSSASREASTALALQSMKTLLSGYAQRANHAEQTTAILMKEKLSPDDMAQLHAVVVAQIDQRSADRAVQQQALLQATLITLNTAASSDDQTCKTLVNTMLRELTMALSHMNPSA